MKALFTILFTLIGAVAIAQIPQAISYQGIIINPSTGETAANGEHSVKFAFYDAATDGDLKWQTTTIPVTTFKGLFTTIIPVPAGAVWDHSLFVELTVDGTVMPTRVQLTTVPYAFKAISADVALTMNAAGLTGTIATSNLPAELQNLTTGPVAGSRVGPGINASNIDNGTLPNQVLNEHLQDLADGTLSSSRIENLDASKVTTGTFDPERIPNLDVSKITGLTPGGAAPTDIDAANITSGILSPSRLGAIPNTLLDTDLQDLADDGVLSASKIEDLNANKITTGTLPVSRGGTGVTTAANGQLLIGNGTGFSAATLTAGTGININNSAGAITISSPQANGSTNGYLSSADWTTFNNKQSAFSFQVPNSVFAGPSAGVLSNQPMFRALVAADIPSLDAAKITTGALPASRGGTGVTTTSSNFVFAGPSAGFPAAPAFRGLVAADIPSLDASILTTGILSTSRLPANLATASSGATNRLAYFTSSTQLSANGLYWDNANNDLGINTTNPEAGVHIAHASGANHVNGTALKIENTYSSTKRGIDVDLTSNGTLTAIGIEVDIDNSGTDGSRIGISSQVNTHASNSSIVNGIEGIASGAGDGSHRGVYGSASSTGSGNLIGVFGEASGSGYKFGLYGKAPSPGYGMYSEGNAGVVGNFGVEGESHFDGDVTVYENLYVDGTVTADNVSDRKLKRQIARMHPTLKSILLLEPSTYYFRKDEYPRLNLELDKQYGLIAQEVENIFPELVIEKTMKEKKDTDGKIIEPELTYKALDYTSLIPILIKGIQEQQAMIDELKQKVKRLEGDNKHNGKPRIVKASNN